MAKKNENLQPGVKIPTIDGFEAEVVKYLGGGGQGDVYIVNYDGQQKALKWYKELGDDPEAFRDNLIQNVNNESPSEDFLWPLDVTEWQDETFGYIMDLKSEGYYELSEFLVGLQKFKSWKIRVDACLEIITSFRLLHNKGYSYQDLNDGNFFINPRTGDVQIADNDNVAPSGENLGIKGKPRYMAPEIVRGDNLPNTPSDRYSLALIIFMLICGGHPLEGRIGTPMVLTDKIAKEIYGDHPVFVYDPDDDSNRPIENVHTNVINVWKCLPDYMKTIFIDAFSQDSLKKARRVTELDWIKALVRFRSDIVRCGACGNEIFTIDGNPTKCDSCGRPANVKNVIKLYDYTIPAVAGTRIYRVQLGTADAAEALNPVAIIIAKKEDPKALGLRNLSEKTWNCVTSKGTDKNLAPKEVMPVKAGITVKVFDETFEIQ